MTLIVQTRGWRCREARIPVQPWPALQRNFHVSNEDFTRHGPYHPSEEARSRNTELTHSLQSQFLPTLEQKRKQLSSKDTDRFGRGNSRASLRAKPRRTPVLMKFHWSVATPIW